MSNTRRIKEPGSAKKEPRICEACQRGEHTGRPHLMDGTPIELTIAERAREEARKMWNSAFGHDP